MHEKTGELFGISSSPHAMSSPVLFANFCLVHLDEEMQLRGRAVWEGRVGMRELE